MASPRKGTGTPRAISFRIPLTEAEHDMLRDLVEREGTSATTIVRAFIRREHEKHFPKRSKR
jgi:hypothetical protein